MRVLYRQLSRFKSEANAVFLEVSRHIKTIEKRRVLDAMLIGYGWHSVEAMQNTHEYVKNAGLAPCVSDNLAGKVRYDLSDIRYVHRLSHEESEKLLSRMRLALITLLESEGVNPDNVEEVIQGYFNKRISWWSRFCDKFISGPDSLTDISRDQWRCSTILVGGEGEERRRLFSGEVLSHAVSQGGVYLLTEGTAKVLFPEIENLCQLMDKPCCLFDHQQLLERNSVHHINGYVPMFSRCNYYSSPISLYLELAEKEGELISDANHVAIAKHYLKDLANRVANPLK